MTASAAADNGNLAKRETDTAYSLPFLNEFTQFGKVPPEDYQIQ